MKQVVRIVVLLLSVSFLSACSITTSPSPELISESPIRTSELLEAAKRSLQGTGKYATVETSTGGLCSGNRVSARITQPESDSAREFYDVATANVITMIAAIKTDPTYKDFGFEYSAGAEGIVDKYGNTSTKEVLWLCYTEQDISKINLSNTSYLVSHILVMNTLGQDDVEKTYGRVR